jgi:SAM-dependent methyltransferase
MLDPMGTARRVKRALRTVFPRRADGASATGEETTATETRIRELEDYCERLQDAVREAGGFSPPPPHLQLRVAGLYYPEFFEHGEWLLGFLQDALGAVGKDLTSFPAVLDFGCGCARVLRAYYDRAAPSQKLYGTDIDAEAIEWCRANYSKMAEFDVNATTPPLAYADEMFDLVFSVSVFTHLPEDLQFVWLRELQRVTKTGGYLLLTTFSKDVFEQAVPEQSREAAREQGFFYDDRGEKTEGLPDFYRQSFHTAAYIRSHWSELFDVVDIRERAVDGHQDIVVCRRR